MPEYTTGKFDRENMRLQKIILDLRAVLRPAVEQAKMRDKYPLSFSDLGADDLVKALLAAGEILGLTEQSAEESEAG